MGSPETRISDNDSFFCNILIKIEIENGGTGCGGYVEVGVI